MRSPRVHARRRAAGLVAAAALLATAACGSTVQTRSDRLTGGGDPLAADSADGLALEEGGDGLAAPDDGLGAPPGAEGELGAPGGSQALGDPGAAPGGAPGGAGGSGGGAQQPAPGGSGGGGGGGGGGGAQQPAPGGSGSGGGAGAPKPKAGGPSGPGVTDKEVFIGLTYTSNGEAANRAIGAGGITQGDQKANYDAIIAEINERGGVAGRQLKPIYYTYDAQSSESRESQDQAACAKFTQDKKVYATGGGLSENFSACMAKAGVLQVNSGELIGKERAFYAKYPNFFDVSTLTQERMLAEQVKTLGRLDYFSGWNPATGQPGPGEAKLGVLTYDDPSFVRPLEQVFLPGLAKAGHPVDKKNVYRVTRPDNQGQVAQTSGETQNAVLRFREAGVTHVMILDENAVLGIAYANAARNQRYLPRLGVNSPTGMQALFDAKIFSNEQLTGAVGLGWLPSFDVPKGDRFLGPATKQCLDIIKKRTGQTFTSSNAASIALAACDQLFLTATAINKAGGTINRDTGRAAIEGLGATFPSALIPAVAFSGGRHDGLQRGYDMVWDSKCPCGKYLDAGRPIP